jgi:type I restriction enzyme M protein
VITYYWVVGEAHFGFTWYKGMSWQVRQRSSIAMAQAIEAKYPHIADKILEVSTKSTNYDIGVALSAKNLLYSDYETGRTLPVENWFQSSKQFSRTGFTCGPYSELLDVDPGMAKRFVNPNPDSKTSEQYKGNALFRQIQDEIAGSKMSSFIFLGNIYPLEPKSAFYDYLYSKALHQEHNCELAKAIGEFTVFTDIEFSPKKSGRIVRYNTQARACAIFVGLLRRGILDAALEDIGSFISCVNYRFADESPLNSPDLFGNDSEELV